MADYDYGYGKDDDGIEQIHPYVQILPSDIRALVRCNRCGGIVEGTSVGTIQHNIWHNNLDIRIEQARNALPRVFGVK